MAEKPLSLFGWIFLGACAAVIGCGYFLFQANNDRIELKHATEQAKKQSEELLEANKKIADEANQKLNTASQEIKNAQEQIRKFEQEQTWLAQATPLVKTRLSNTWKEWINMPLGFTLRLPENNGNAGNETLFDFGWLKIEPYDQGREELLRAQASSTNNIEYFVDGRLLIGTRGPEWVLRDQSGGKSTILIWAKPEGQNKEQQWLEILATLTFRNDKLE